MFIEILALKSSISRRKLVYGVGINDAKYVVQPKIKGKQVTCHFYSTWKNMLSRCYSFYYIVKFPTYINTIVCDEWLTFSNFKSWMEKQNWKGKCLDKDIVKQGNKIYSPKNCIFVTNDINNLINGQYSRRGKYPQGVYWNKEKEKFHAQCNVNNKKKHIGYFNSSKEAHKAYVKFKKNLIINIIINNQFDDIISKGLLKYVEQL